MSSSCLRTLIGLSGVLVMLLPSSTEAQIVRRFAGGGIRVNAPFVRVDIGPGGGTSVRAPFTAVDRPGRIFLGRRRRLMAQPQHAAPQQRVTPRTQASTQARAQQPTPVDVDALPYPTASQLAAMEDAVLVETLREMMGRLNYRLSLLKTGEGWQRYLVLPRELLGSPGAPPESAQLDKIQKVLPHFRGTLDDPQFVKIFTLPSFVAAYNTLEEVSRRFSGDQIGDPLIGDPLIGGPEITDPNSSETTPTDQPAEKANGPIEEAIEILPTPQPAEVPNATRGERSILKRK